MVGNINQILFMAQSSMLARANHLDMVSSNLANMNTIGYKTTRANFQELLNGASLSGVGIKSSQRIMDQGPLLNTGRPLDVAIQGEGYFGFTNANGEQVYTRDGQFTQDSDKNLVTISGMKINWTGTIPADSEEVHINPDGTVMSLTTGTWTEIGNLELYKFPNPSGLTSIGDSTYLETEVSGEVISGVPGLEGYGTIVSGVLEQSNVDLSKEMTRLLTLQRGFELSISSFQTTSQMLSQAIHMRRS